MAATWEKYSQDGPWAKYSVKPRELDALDNPDPTGSFGENLAAGAGKAITDLGRGGRQILSNVPFLNRLDTFNPDKVQAEVDQSRAADAPLMKTAGGLAGYVAGSAVPAALAPGVGYANAIGVGSALGALTPTSGDESRLLNTAIGGASGAAAKFATDKAGQFLSSRLQNSTANLANKQAQDAGRFAVLKDSQAAGYVVPPTSANSTVINNTIEGLSGKIKTAQVAAEKNQVVTNSLARKALGLADDSPLDETVLGSIRDQAGKAYQAIKNFPQKFQADQQFATDISTLGRDFQAAAQEFPEIAGNASIDSLKSALSKPDMSPKAAVELIKKLRFDASKNFKAFDDPAKAALADAQKSAANAIEGLVERNLAQSGQAGLVDSFRAARQLIAKTYDVESALVGGNVSAPVLARLSAKGPMTGELGTVAKFATEFPKAAQLLKEAPNAISPLDVGLAFATGNPAMLAARPAARAAILSKPYQSFMTTPSYTPSAILRMGSGAANNALLKATAGPTAVNALLYANQQ